MSADPLHHQPSEVPGELSIEVCRAAILEFQSVCDRFDLSVTQRLHLLADMTAYAAVEIATCEPGWGARPALEIVARHARARATLLIKSR